MEKRHYIRGFVPYMLGAFLVALVGGLTSVLAPAVVEEFGIPYSNTTWSTLAMTVSSAALAPIMGKMCDSIGRRKILIFGLAVYTLGTFLVSIAASMPVMLTARFTVGVGTAVVAPVVLSYIVAEFPDSYEAKGFSAYLLISGSAVVFGPTLGGYMIAAFGWRSMMRMCVRFCLIVLLACVLLTHGDTFARRHVEGMDRLGALFVFVFFGSALCVPAFIQNFGFDLWYTWAIGIIAFISLWVLIYIEHRAENPILPGGFIRRKSFVLGVIALFLTQGLKLASVTNTIVFINYTHPDETMVSSYIISILYLGLSIGSALIVPLADEYEPKHVLSASLLVTAVGISIMYFFNVNTPFYVFALALGIFGFGLGGNAGVFMKIILADVPREFAGAGAGTYGLFRDLASPFGVAVLVPFFTNGITRRIDSGISSGVASAIPSADLTSAAAVDAVHTLASVELICVFTSIFIVQFLPYVKSVEN